MLDEFTLPVNKVRKGDTILSDDPEDWRGDEVVYSKKCWSNFEGEEGYAWKIKTLKHEEDWDYSTYPRYGIQPSDDYDSPEDYYPEDCLNERLYRSDDEQVRIRTNDVQLLDSNLQPYRWWVAVFEVDRGFGGPEEGGWWFDAGQVQQVVPCSSYEIAEETREKLIEEWPNTGNASSVNYSGGQYSVVICKNYPEDYPKRVPHYS